jgi:RNA polymerase sigma factor (sigma-70 family)
MTPDDGALVAAMVRKDPSGLDEVYRRYAGALRAFCEALLRDRDAAADVVHDTFVIACERAGQLRDPERLRPWLYTIARRECLRRLRTSGRTVPLADPSTVYAEPVDLDAPTHNAQLRALVRDALDGLDGIDRATVELLLNGDATARDVGAVLGLPPDHARVRMSRSRAQLASTLGALLVARAGAGECATLDAILAGWDGRLTVPLRKRLDRHVRECETCSCRRRRELSPSALLAILAAIGLPAASVTGGLSDVDDLPPTRKRMAILGSAAALFVAGAALTLAVLPGPQTGAADLPPGQAPATEEPATQPAVAPPAAGDPAGTPSGGTTPGGTTPGGTTPGGAEPPGGPPATGPTGGAEPTEPADPRSSGGVAPTLAVPPDAPHNPPRGGAPPQPSPTRATRTVPPEPGRH